LCASTADANAGELSGVDEGAGGTSTAIGLLPGGATRVTVHHGGGTDSTIPATNGLWVINNDRSATGLSASTVSRTVPVPSLPGASH
jgi:hypothetical protein